MITEAQAAKTIQKGNLYSLTYLSKIKWGRMSNSKCPGTFLYPLLPFPQFSYPPSPSAPQLQSLIFISPPSILPAPWPPEALFFRFSSMLSLNSPSLDLLSLSSKSFSSSYQLLLFLHHNLLHLRECSTPTGEEPKTAASSCRAGQGGDQGTAGKHFHSVILYQSH